MKTKATDEPFCQLCAANGVRTLKECDSPGAHPHCPKCDRVARR